MKRKLTPFARILIVLLIVLAAFFAIRYLAPQLMDQTAKKETTEQQVEETRSDDTKEAVVDNPATRPGNFSYIPKKPENGTLKGVVELGASGFNSFIIEKDATGIWELEKAEFGASLVHENMATEQDIRDGLKQYIAKMLDYGVSGNEIHFMMSSSAVKSPKVQKISTALKSMGYVVNAVNGEQEGIYALKAALPDAYRDNAFVVDIGSGNTKISWVEGGDVKSLESYGSKFYQNDVSDNKVYREISQLASQVPAAKTKYCFIIGGTPFKLAKEVRQGDERYTVLKGPKQYDVDDQKTKSGLVIYEAIYDETGCRTFVFDWDANFTIGWLLSL